MMDLPNLLAFPIEEVARLPLPGTAYPGSIQFSPDGRWIGYLLDPEGGLIRRLYLYDLQTGETIQVGDGKSIDENGFTAEENLSAQDRLRRERQRQYELGITSFTWSPVGERLLFPLPDGLYIQDGAGGARNLIVPAVDHSAKSGFQTGGQNSPPIDPQFSPDGNWIAFVRNSEIWVVPATGGAARQLTHGASQAGVIHGLAEYIAQEEMGRSQGYWWSPDSRSVAFIEVDESHIPEFYIVHQGKDDPGPAAQERHRYPFAGQANARVRLGIISLEGGEPNWVDMQSIFQSDDFYLARVCWLPNDDKHSPGSLVVQLENRSQTELCLVRYDISNNAVTILLKETNPIWINLHDLFRPLKNGRFIWGSERNGYRHLYLYENNGNLIRALTSGDWIVDCLVDVDEEKGLVYFTGTFESPLECHLYAVSLFGGELIKITQASGMHNVVTNIRRNGGIYIDTHDSLQQPPVVNVYSLEKNNCIHTLWRPTDPRIADLGIRSPEIITFSSRDGQDLYGAMFRPSIEFGDGPFPTIVQVYGGPHAQLVSNGWRSTVNLRAQYLCNLGFLVFILDNRGSARRGLAFEGGIKHHLGELEVQDQVDGVRWLVDRGLTDPARVGIYGWSYGGYMALMCLARAPETFHAAVAGAPVTAWDGYDTHYTERYMGTPLTNPSGYAASAVIPHVPAIKGRLLLVHGLIDENVHFRHTARLINALIRARKPYELMLFPDERHGPRRLEDRVYLEERIRDFFQASLA